VFPSSLPCHLYDRIRPTPALLTGSFATPCSQAPPANTTLVGYAPRHGTPSSPRLARFLTTEFAGGEDMQLGLMLPRYLRSDKSLGPGLLKRWSAFNLVYSAKKPSRKCYNPKPSSRLTAALQLLQINHFGSHSNHVNQCRSRSREQVG
jgi:hypothetical protein